MSRELLILGGGRSPFASICEQRGRYEPGSSVQDANRGRHQSPPLVALDHAAGVRLVRLATAEESVAELSPRRSRALAKIQGREDRQGQAIPGNGSGLIAVDRMPIHQPAVTRPFKKRSAWRSNGRSIAAQPQRTTSTKNSANRRPFPRGVIFGGQSLRLQPHLALNPLVRDEGDHSCRSDPAASRSAPANQTLLRFGSLSLGFSAKDGGMGAWPMLKYSLDATNEPSNNGILIQKSPSQASAHRML